MKTLILACLVAFLANMTFAEASTLKCPMPESSAERDLIITEGPSFVETKGIASPCLRRILDREKKILGQDDDLEMMLTLISGSAKAEYESIEQPY